MSYNPMSYAVNGQGYYSFPAYRSFVGGGNPASGTPAPGSTQGTMQGSFPQAMYQQQMVPSGTPAGPLTQVAPATLPGSMTPGGLPVEQSYIENILRLNLGKIGTFYMTYENNTQWNAKIFKGTLEAAGRDHIIISDPKSGMRYLLLMVNLDYATFDEPLQYSYPYQQGTR
jgi:spore germination protein Q